MLVKDLFSIKGKTAVLTGAAGFLGRTMARTLMMNGARVVALGRSAKLMTLEKEWAREYGKKNIKVHKIDMYNHKALAHLLEKIAAEERSIDILVNNAHEMNPKTGFNSLEGGLEKATHDMWMRNLTGSIYWPALTTQKLGAVMKKKGGGSIINISSMYGLVAPSPQLYAGTPFVNPPGYSASKAGMLALTRYTASFWGKFGVRCNAILPGPFSNTEDKGPNSVNKEDPFLQRLHARTCLGRTGQAHELSGALLFLSSQASSYVTGHALTVDGGWTVI